MGGQLARLDPVNKESLSHYLPKEAPRPMDVNQNGNGSLVVAGPDAPVAYIPYSNPGVLSGLPAPVPAAAQWSGVAPYPWFGGSIVDAGDARLAGWYEGVDSQGRRSRTLALWTAPEEWWGWTRAMFAMPEFPGVVFVLVASEEGTVLIPMDGARLQRTLGIATSQEKTTSTSPLVLPVLAAAHAIAACPADRYDACYELGISDEATVEGLPILQELRQLDSLDRPPADSVLALIQAMRDLAIADFGLVRQDVIGPTTVSVSRPSGSARWTLGSGWRVTTQDGRIVFAEAATEGGGDVPSGAPE